MNAKEMLDLLISLQEKGYDLNDLPLLIIENNQGITLSKDYVILVKNVKKFNEEQNIILQSQFDQVLLLGPIVECDD